MCSRAQGPMGQGLLLVCPVLLPSGSCLGVSFPPSPQASLFPFLFLFPSLWPQPCSLLPGDGRMPQLLPSLPAIAGEPPPSQPPAPLAQSLGNLLDWTFLVHCRGRADGQGLASSCLWPSSLQTDTHSYLVEVGTSLEPSWKTNFFVQFSLYNKPSPGAADVWASPFGASTSGYGRRRRAVGSAAERGSNEGASGAGCGGPVLPSPPCKQAAPKTRMW